MIGSEGMRREAPANNEALRQALYRGEIFHLPATSTTRELAAELLVMLDTTLGPQPREAQHRMSNPELFAQIGKLRRTLFMEERFHEAVRAVLRAYGFDPARSAFDALRLRVVTHRGFEIPEAAAVYLAHRDTWYSHPQCQIAWWIALHDVPETETFVFFPERFAQPVPNRSETFDYDEWVREGWDLKIGWQKFGAGQAEMYPGQDGLVSAGRQLGFSASAGDLVLFSGQHYHQTRRNLSGRTRFSLDFRTVDLPDHAAGHGAPNVDNRSRGSVLRDYVKPPTPDSVP